MKKFKTVTMTLLGVTALGYLPSGYAQVTRQNAAPILSSQNDLRRVAGCRPLATIILSNTYFSQTAPAFDFLNQQRTPQENFLRQFHNQLNVEDKVQIRLAATANSRGYAIAEPTRHLINGILGRTPRALNNATCAAGTSKRKLTDIEARSIPPTAISLNWTCEGRNHVYTAPISSSSVDFNEDTGILKSCSHRVQSAVPARVRPARAAVPASDLLVCSEMSAVDLTTLRTSMHGNYNGIDVFVDGDQFHGRDQYVNPELQTLCPEPVVVAREADDTSRTGRDTHEAVPTPNPEHHAQPANDSSGSSASTDEDQADQNHIDEHDNGGSGSSNSAEQNTTTPAAPPANPVNPVVPPVVQTPAPPVQAPPTPSEPPAPVTPPTQPSTPAPVVSPPPAPPVVQQPAPGPVTVVTPPAPPSPTPPPAPPVVQQPAPGSVAVVTPPTPPSPTPPPAPPVAEQPAPIAPVVQPPAPPAPVTPPTQPSTPAPVVSPPPAPPVVQQPAPVPPVVQPPAPPSPTTPPAPTPAPMDPETQRNLAEAERLIQEAGNNPVENDEIRRLEEAARTQREPLVDAAPIPERVQRPSGEGTHDVSTGSVNEDHLRNLNRFPVTPPPAPGDRPRVEVGSGSTNNTTPPPVAPPTRPIDANGQRVRLTEAQQLPRLQQLMRQNMRKIEHCWQLNVGRISRVEHDELDQEAQRTHQPLRGFAVLTMNAYGELRSLTFRSVPNLSIRNAMNACLDPHSTAEDTGADATPAFEQPLNLTFTERQ